MNILQSLWLCDPPENEQVLKRKDKRYVDDDFNHTSSSGVDVNSGSTGSGNSSDGVNGNISQLHTSPGRLKKVQELCEDEAEAEAQSTSEKEAEAMSKEKEMEDDPATDETIRSNDSPKELPETPPSSDKSSGSDSKMMSPDPVWVLTLLTKIEKQFMTHYVDAMTEFKVRWNLDNNEQLDLMINELKTEVQKRIKTSINRELNKIQECAGLPRPPSEAMSRASTTQTERRRRLKVMLKQSTDPQEDKSDDSATATSYSDQRSENDDDYCPCEACMDKKMTYIPPIPAEVMNAAPIVKDFDLKRFLLRKNGHPGNTQATTCTSHSEKESDRIAVETLIGKVIFEAIREIEEDEEDGSEGREEDEETVKVSSIDDDDDDDDEDEVITEDERAESENADTGMVEDKSLTENTCTAGEEMSGEDSTTKPYQVETKKGWLIIKRRLLPTMHLIIKRRAKTQQLMTADENIATDEDLSKEPDEEAEHEDVESETAEDESKEEADEATNDEDGNAGEETDLEAEMLDNDEEIPAISEDDSANENDGTAEESSKEPAEDVIALGRERLLGQVRMNLTKRQLKMKMNPTKKRLWKQRQLRMKTRLLPPVKTE
ncbi:hypothetical protein CgunFtcFv8_007391 [Champsocephalus gunnari]|uniref:Uncharacterized protein n=2 Tax=Champsocephalus gunnari TaxID=52237 RepID=A0AAN8CJL9_CHAGU|nr:hypothetical protein CgunFtcFv8_007391 [Champsocephalus gunnari]